MIILNALFIDIEDINVIKILKSSPVVVMHSLPTSLASKCSPTSSAMQLIEIYQHFFNLFKKNLL